jgi:hypothetical protein
MIDILELTIWGREYSLPVIYDSLSDGVISDSQIKAVENFKKHLEWIDSSKSVVEEYCKEDVMDDDENEKKDNIFSYIKPERLYVKRESELPRVALMCRYRYDPEHGLAIVYSQDGKVTVGIQDIII